MAYAESSANNQQSTDTCLGTLVKRRTENPAATSHYLSWSCCSWVAVCSLWAYPARYQSYLVQGLLEAELHSQAQKMGSLPRSKRFLSIKGVMNAQRGLLV